MLLRRPLIALLQRQSMRRGISDKEKKLLEQIKNQEQGIYEPKVHEFVKLDLKKQYLKNCQVTNMALNGIITGKDVIHLQEDLYAHLNNLPLLNAEHFVSPYAHMAKTEEEEYMHEVPYGYVLGDDVFLCELFACSLLSDTQTETM